MVNFIGQYERSTDCIKGSYLRSTTRPDLTFALCESFHKEHNCFLLCHVVYDLVKWLSSQYNQPSRQ